MTSDKLSDFLLTGRHGQIVGPAGSGKTHLAKHMALFALDNDTIPLFISAQHFEGKLSTLLDRSIAHVYPNSASHFLKIVRHLGHRIVLVVDAIDRCRSQLFNTLLDLFTHFT